MAVDTQRGSGYERALEAVAFALAENGLGRARGVGVVVFNRVDEALNAHGRVERAQGAEVARGEAKSVAGTRGGQGLGSGLEVAGIIANDSSQFVVGSFQLSVVCDQWSV